MLGTADPSSTFELSHWLLWGVALRGCLVLLTGYLALLILRNATSAQRHFVLSLTAFGLLAVPTLSVILPGWSVEVPWLNSEWNATAISEADAAPDALSTAPRSLATDAPDTPRADMLDENSNDATAARTMLEQSGGKRAHDLARAPDTVVQLEPLHSRLRASVLRRLPIAWLTGCVFMAGLLCSGLLLVSHVQRRGRRLVDPSWQDLLASLCKELDIRRRVRLYAGSGIRVPLTWGLLWPVVILPEESRDWTHSRRRTVLLHELAHIKRMDWAADLVTRFRLAIHWFNPLVWHLAQLIQVERERASDDVVLSHGAEAEDYAAELLYFVKQLKSRSSWTFGAVAMARSQSFQQRIVGILDVSRRRAGLSRFGMVVGATLCLCLLIPLTAIRVVAAKVNPDEAETSIPDGNGPVDRQADGLKPAKKPVNQDETPARGSGTVDDPRLGTRATKAQLSSLPFGRPRENGLRIAWVISRAKSSYVEGDLLWSRLFFLNAGARAITFTRSHDTAYDTIQVKFADGREMQGQGVVHFGNFGSTTFRLEPGQIVETGFDAFAVGKPIAKGVIRQIPVKAGQTVEVYLRMTSPEFLPELESGKTTRSGHIESAPFKLAVTSGTPNTVVAPRSAVAAGTHDLFPGLRVNIRKGRKEDGTPDNAVTIQWIKEGEIIQRRPIEVPPLDSEFGIAWGEGPGAYRRTDAHRFWIAKANAVTEVAIHSKDDVRIENFGWSMHENFGKDVYRPSTLSSNYGGMPIVVMSRLESLRPARHSILPPKSDLLGDLNLSKVPVRTCWDAMRSTPDLYVPDPKQPRDWTRAEGVFPMPIGEGLWVQYPVESGQFYIEYRPDGSWENEQTYGPIPGDPFERLGLEEYLKETLQQSSLGGGAIYRLRRMIRTRSIPLTKRACRIILANLTEESLGSEVYRTIELLDAAREGMRNQRELFAADEMKQDADRLRAAISRIERAIDKLNELPAESYQSVTYLQDKDGFQVPDSLWGKPRSGLRMAVVPQWDSMPSSVTVKAGQSISVKLLVENVSDQDIRITAYVTSEAGRIMQVLGADNEPVASNGMYTTIPPLLGRWRLKPGERYMLSVPELHFVEDSPLFRMPKNPGLGQFFQVHPGEYRLRCGYRFGRFDNTRHRHVPGQSEWIGQLAAGDIKLTVVDPKSGPAD